MPPRDAESLELFYANLRSNEIGKLLCRFRDRINELVERRFLNDPRVVGFVAEGYDVNFPDKRSIAIVVETLRGDKSIKMVIYPDEIMPSLLLEDSEGFREVYLDSSHLVGDRRVLPVNLSNLTFIATTSYIPLSDSLDSQKITTYTEGELLDQLYSKCAPGCFPQFPEVEYFYRSLSIDI